MAGAKHAARSARPWCVRVRVLRCVCVCGSLCGARRYRCSCATTRRSWRPMLLSRRCHTQGDMDAGAASVTLGSAWLRWTVTRPMPWVPTHITLALRLGIRRLRLTAGLLFGCGLQPALVCNVLGAETHKLCEMDTVRPGHIVSVAQFIRLGAVHILLCNVRVGLTLIYCYTVYTQDGCFSR